MQVELTSLLVAAQETETKMVEMSALNHLMSTHVLHQAQQIELLYEQVRYEICLSTCVILLEMHGSLQLAFILDGNFNLLCHIESVGKLQNCCELRKHMHFGFKTYELIWLLC